MGKVIGIDLGTTNSCVAFVDKDGSVKVIPTRLGSNTMPSMIAFDKSGQRLVGAVAKRQPPSENIFYETKRLIGRRYDEAKKLEDVLSYRLAKSDNGDAWVESRGTKYSPSQMGSYILAALKEDAEAYLNEKVTQAVITVPAYFDDAQRQATKDAGALAGLEVLRIINEPTAAALAYGLEKKKTGTIAVYDLGGGTFDVSILRIEDGVFEVLATNGDTLLGGGHFDQAIVEYLKKEYEAQNSAALDTKNDKMALHRLKEAAEKAKIELSTAMQTDITLPFLSADSTGPKHLNTTLTRAKLEQLVEILIKKTMDPCKKAIADANLKTSDIEDVVMVGGMTRMPRVIEIVKDFFGKEPHRGVNPDEVVACGAAIQGSVLAGESNQDIVLLDVTSLTFGIETEGSIMTPIIERNTTIPCKKSQVFSTAADNQTQVHIRIFQGERTLVADNKLLGEFVLDGIPSARRGTPQIEVTFNIDSNGILNVSAVDKASNKEQSVQIRSSGGLSKEEIEQMIKDAEAYSEEDKKKRELIEKKNQLESLIHSVNTNLEEHKDKLSEEEAKNIQDAIERAKQIQSNEDVTVLTSAIDDLTKNSMKLGEILYKDKQNNSGSSDNHNDSNQSDANPDVVDIE
jgi:molecular chaperone DnaK